MCYNTNRSRSYKQFETLERKDVSCMAHYNLTYACGHAGTVELFGKREYREKRIQWLEGSVDCPACKKRAAELKMQNFEKEYELPALEGTPKQIAWARDIRKDILTSISYYIDHEENSRKKQLGIEMMDFFSAKDTSRFWIENREIYDPLSVHQIRKKYRELSRTQLEKDAREEAILVPAEGSQFDGVVTVEVQESVLTLKTYKNNKFISLVKRYGFRWNGAAVKWERQIFPITTAEDQTSEIVYHLLKSGFSCCVLDDIARENVISGNFVPMGTRIICVKDNMFIFYLLDNTQDDCDEIFEKLRRIGKKSSYNVFKVKNTMYRAVGDVAQKYGFKISEGAKQLIEAQIQQEIKVTVGDCLDSEKIEQISQKIQSHDPLADLLDDD